MPSGEMILSDTVYRTARANRPSLGFDVWFCPEITKSIVVYFQSSDHE